jgi:hypothetical protein
MAYMVQFLPSKHEAFSSTPSAIKTQRKTKKTSRALVAHACNTSSSEGRDQKDRGSNPAQTNNSREPISKKTSQNIKGTGGVAPGVGPEFKPQYRKKKKKRQKILNLAFQ